MKITSYDLPDTGIKRIIFDVSHETLAHVMENVLIERILSHAAEELWKELRPQLEADVRAGLTSAIMMERVGDKIATRLVESLLKEPLR